MAAILIINYDTTDPERLDAYRPPAVDALSGPGKGKFVAVTDDTIDLAEGNGAGETTVILEYPDVASARSAYDSDAYQAVIGERFAATNPGHAIIVPVLEPES